MATESSLETDVGGVLVGVATLEYDSSSGAVDSTGRGGRGRGRGGVGMGVERGEGREGTSDAAV